jgi:hypothetical protein
MAKAATNVRIVVGSFVGGVIGILLGMTPGHAIGQKGQSSDISQYRNTDTAQPSSAFGQNVSHVDTSRASAMQILGTLGDATSLENYRARAIERIRQLSPSAVVFASVTFNRPISTNEIDHILREVSPEVLGFRSFPDGKGMIPYGNGGDSIDKKLEGLEREISVHMKTLNGVDNFRILNGYVSARVRGSVADLGEILKNRNVYLVDVDGSESVSVDVYDQLENTQIDDDVKYNNDQNR